MIFDVLISGPEGVLPIITGYREKKEKRNMYHIAIIQLGTIYFWALKRNGKVIASSSLIAEKSLVATEAAELSLAFGLEIIVEERE
jgi:hypothetical protein